MIDERLTRADEVIEQRSETSGIGPFPTYRGTRTKSALRPKTDIGIGEALAGAGGHNLLKSALQTPKAVAMSPRLRGGPGEVSLADHDLLFLDCRS
jgi:hypothetical protein